MRAARLALAFFLASCVPAPAQDVRPPATVPQPERGFGLQEARQVTARRHMAVAAHPLAARAGADVLRAGGNAIDAAVAVQFVLNLVEPQSSGIGGGAFLLYWDAKRRELMSLDGRETAPAAAGPDLFMKPDGISPVPFWQAVVGGRSVGVPGTLKLLEEAHRNWGGRPWASLVEPAIRLAEEGFPVSPRLSQAIAEAKDTGLGRFPEARAYFLGPDGNAPPPGTVLRNPALAETLRLVAREGARALHDGPLGDSMVEAVRTPDNPGTMTREDLAGYEVKRREPVCVAWRVYQVCGMGPPSSGGIAVAQILKLLEGSEARQGWGPLSMHLFAEASKLAFADRNRYVADPDFGRVPAKGLLDAAYLRGRAALVSRERAMPRAEPGEPPGRDARLGPDATVEAPGTSHFVIRDAEGNAVSMTTTIEAGFGSRVMTRGFLLNNELTDFSFRPVMEGLPVANRVEPGKRPRSSMAPTIVLRDGEPVLLIGSPGGARIIPYVAQALIAILDWGMEPQEAIALGHVVNLNGATELEAGTEAADLHPALEAMGHRTVTMDLNSGLHAILIRDGLLVGAVDPRREGAAIGE